MMRTIIASAAVIAAALGAGVSAQQHVKESIISDAAAAAWAFEGAAKVKPVDAPGVPGGKALSVAVAAKGANPWDIQARLKLKDGVAAGDTVTFGFYARAEKPDPGKTTATVNVRFQRNAAPYDAALEGPVEIGPEWSFVCLAGPARIALAAADMSVSVQLAGDKHVVAFGPYMATRIPAQGPNVKSGLPCGQPVESG